MIMWIYTYTNNIYIYCKYIWHHIWSIIISYESLHEFTHAFTRLHSHVVKCRLVVARRGTRFSRNSWTWRPPGSPRRHPEGGATKPLEVQWFIIVFWLQRKQENVDETMEKTEIHEMKTTETWYLDTNDIEIYEMSALKHDI